jgi:GNAT superfamily N-acetyltransferase
MDWQIRLAKTADFADIQQLFQLVERLHHEALPTLFRPTDDIERSEAFLQEWLTDEEGKLWVAEVNGRVIALIFAKLYQRSEHPFIQPHREVYIHEMVVAQAYQGQGVAQALMNKVVPWATAVKVDRVRLQVFEFNQRAQAFYRKQGFTTTSRYMWLPLPQ